MSKKLARNIILLSAIIIAMLTVALNIGVIWGAVDNLLVVIEPIVIGFCVAFILNIIMNFFELRVYKKLSTEKKPRKMLRRILSLVSTLVIVALAIALVLLVIIPQVSATASSIVAGLPAFAKKATAFVRELLERFDVKPERISELVLGGEKIIDTLVTFAETNLNSFLKSIVSIGGSVVGVTSDIFFGLFIAIYFLADKDRVKSQCTRLIRAVIKDGAYERVSHIGTIASKSFSNFISGQFIEAIILGALCFIGMLIFGFPYAPVVSVLIAVTALVPIVGAWLGGGLSAVLILISDPIKALWFLLFFVILQQIEGNFIYPRVVGKQVGLPGVWVLIAVVVGSGLFGPAGALISVPLTSVLYVLASEFVKGREKEVVNDRPVE